MRVLGLLLLGSLLGCPRTDHPSLRVTHVEVEIHGECTHPGCSMDALAPEPLKSVSSAFEGYAYQNNAGQWTFRNCGAYPLAFAQYHATRTDPDGGVEVFSGWNQFLGADNGADVWASYSNPPNSDLNPFVGGGSLYAVLADGTISRSSTPGQPHDAVPFLEDAGLLVYRFELSRYLPDGGTEVDPAGLVVVETHRFTSGPETVEVEFLDQCPSTPSFPTSGGGGWY